MYANEGSIMFRRYGLTSCSGAACLGTMGAGRGLYPSDSPDAGGRPRSLAIERRL